MRFTGRADALPIRARDVVQLEVLTNGVYQPAFYGVVTICPNPDDPREGEFVVQGARVLLKRAVPTFTRFRDVTVGAVALDVIQNATSSMPQLGIDAVQSGLGTISEWFVVAQTDQILDQLASMAFVPAGERAVTWGVDASGKVFFRQPSSTLNLGLETVESLMPINADDTVTAVTMILSGENPALASTMKAQRLQITDYTVGPIKHRGNPIVYRCVHPEHALYQQEKIVQAFGEAFSRLIPGSYSSTLFSNAGNAFDSDLDTYASNQVGLNNNLGATLPGIVGVDLEYSTVDTYPDTISVTFNTFNAAQNALVQGISVDLPGTGGHTNRNTFRLVYEYDGSDAVGPVQIGVKSFYNSGTTADVVRVYTFLPLVKSPRLISEANSLLNLPASIVRELRISEYRAPTPQVQLSRGVGRDPLVGDTNLFEYALTVEDGFETVIKLGDSGTSETAKLIRLLANDLDRRDLTAVRRMTGGVRS
jgi:hypothetical protein